jgi:hypothetical protein
MVVKLRSSCGQTVVKLWSNCDQTAPLASRGAFAATTKRRAGRSETLRNAPKRSETPRSAVPAGLPGRCRAGPVSGWAGVGLGRCRAGPVSGWASVRLGRLQVGPLHGRRPAGPAIGPVSGRAGVRPGRCPAGNRAGVRPGRACFRVGTRVGRPTAGPSAVSNRRLPPATGLDRPQYRSNSGQTVIKQTG